MRIGIISVYVDYHRRGKKNRVSMQPQIGTLLAGLLPRDVEVDVINEQWSDPDWSRDYDLLFISALHPDFDRARQLSHYWRRRGAKTVFGGAFASSYPGLCAPYFDAVVVGDPETTVPEVYRDFRANRLRSRYESPPYDGRTVATPRFELLAGRALHPLALEATRGCPFSCEFCVLTGQGTRFETRPVESVVRDIVAGQQQLHGLIPDYKRRLVGFTDNNIGGSFSWLRRLCDAVEPLDIQWYAAATFNVISNRDMVRRLSHAGCRCLFVGLESFNPATLADMNKRQNALGKVQRAIADCLAHGILVVAGLMVSPATDDVDYIRALPLHLSDAGLYVPTFLCFESPIPGTPHFHRLAATPGALLPNVLLRDLAGYTLTARPRHATVEAFVDAYRETHAKLFGMNRRLRKLAHDLPRLLGRGYWFPAAIDVGDMLTMQAAGRPAATRTYIAGTDTPPPERVPLTAADFRSEDEHDRITQPWVVTDRAGAVLPIWHRSRTTHGVRTVIPAPPHGQSPITGLRSVRAH